ncbi:MAG: hypothetical protein ABL996_18865 [Micropepsaceae bacterium]
MRVQRRLFACLLFICEIGSASGSESFQFWPGKGAAAALGFQRMSEHPCGEVAYAEVSRLPTAKNGPLLSEVVVELNRRGKVARRWPMPVDYVPRALRGEELLVVAGDIGFWIRSNGSFRKATTIPAPEDRSGLFKCDLTRVFGKSAYAGCSVFVDLVSHKERTLGYQGVCS